MLGIFAVTGSDASGAGGLGDGGCVGSGCCRDGDAAAACPSSSGSVGFETVVTDCIEGAKKAFLPAFLLGSPFLWPFVAASASWRTGTAFMGRAISRTEEKARMGGGSLSSPGVIFWL